VFGEKYTPQVRQVLLGMIRELFDPAEILVHSVVILDVEFVIQTQLPNSKEI
jgi:hypothetical protein